VDRRTFTSDVAKALDHLYDLAYLHGTGWPRSCMVSRQAASSPAQGRRARADEVVATRLIEGRRRPNRRGQPVSLPEAGTVGRVGRRARGGVLPQGLGGLFTGDPALLRRICPPSDRRGDGQDDPHRRRVDEWPRASPDAASHDENHLDAPAACCRTDPACARSWCGTATAAGGSRRGLRPARRATRR